MEQEEGVKLDLGSIDFTPDWARKGAGVSVGKVYQVREDRGERQNRGERKPFKKRVDSNFRPRFEERPRRLEAEVKVLPETKALGTIIRKLQGDFHAYKLKDLAYFFLDNPESVQLRISPLRGENGEAPKTTFFQCKACGFASTRQEDVIEHAVAVHLADYYDAKEIDVEPPKGNFNCVAKCGLSGVLLGPPNIHEFNSVVREMIRTRYPDMSESQYRAHIEMVRDPEAIEEWRKGAVKKTVYFAKGQASVEGAAQLSREQAESEFRVGILSSLLETPKTLVITAAQAVKSPVVSLQWAAKDALEQERRAPYAMIFALRGAFHHRKLKFFRANDARGPEFVTNTELKPFDAAHAIPELAAMARFVEEHPCLDIKELPDADSLKHLQWLVSTGHVVAFTNGVYSAVEKYPKYGPQWKKRGGKAKDAIEKSAAGESPTEVKAEVVAEKKTELEEQSVAEEKKEDAVTPVVAE